MEMVNPTFAENITLIEGGLTDEEIENPKNHDLMWWRKILYRLKIQKQDLNQKESVKRQILQLHDASIEKKRGEIDYLEDLIKNNLEASPFKTKTGGFKIDHFPDIGTISLSKPSPKFTVTNDDYWIGKGYTRTIPEKTALDKKILTTHLKSMMVRGGTVFDPETGEVMEGITVETTRTFKCEVR